MEKWQYDVVTLTGKNMEQDREKLNDFGKDGWELVCIIPKEITVPRTLSFAAYFKRKII